ncbi:MAG: hypothetical protein IJ661_11000, partial [Lachnospiraceae bacterium]|nr:hypothetical protein [Lachnospiraceae bacterium]
DGQRVDHTENNIFLENITKEEIVEKKLFVYVPFYIIRYERELTSEKDYEKVLKDLEFLYEAMLQWKNNREITDVELADLSSCMRVVARHITDGNEIEDKVVKAMGGEIIELPSDRLREAEEKLAELNTAMKEADARAEEADARANEADARAERYMKILIENGIKVD